MRHNLKAAIETRFGTQLAFAKVVNLSAVRINRLCRGWVDPTPIERERIAEALRADAVWLFNTVTRIPGPTIRGESEAPAPAVSCASGASR